MAAAAVPIMVPASAVLFTAYSMELTNRPAPRKLGVRRGRGPLPGFGGGATLFDRGWPLVALRTSRSTASPSTIPPTCDVIEEMRATSGGREISSATLAQFGNPAADPQSATFRIGTIALRGSTWKIRWTLMASFFAPRDAGAEADVDATPPVRFSDPRICWAVAWIDATDF